MEVGEERLYGQAGYPTKPPSPCKQVLSHVSTAKKSDRKACVMMHVQSKNPLPEFLTLLKLPNETNRTDISFLFRPSMSLLNK